MRKVLVLYSELAGYFTACLREFVADGQHEVHVVRWPVHPEAPFQFPDEPGIVYHERKGLDVGDIIRLGEQIQPAGLYVAGWIDKDYVKVARHFKRKGVPVIAAFDTHWKGTWRQKLAILLSPLFIRTAYSHCWVPGMYQYEYARRLGYARDHISTGMYAADTTLFRRDTESRLESKAVHYPKTFLYVGRLLELKGLDELCAAFIQLFESGRQEWNLRLVGNGPLGQTLPKHPAIEVLPFVQPSELPALADDAGCLVLPSRSEAWGMVVHEFAAAGLPLILSNQVGGHTAFLKSGYNGFLAQSENVESLAGALRKMMDKTDDERLLMSRRSIELSQQLSPQTWSATLREILTLD